MPPTIPTARLNCLNDPPASIGAAGITAKKVKTVRVARVLIARVLIVVVVMGMITGCDVPPHPPLGPAATDAEIEAARRGPPAAVAATGGSITDATSGRTGDGTSGDTGDNDPDSAESQSIGDHPRWAWDAPTSRIFQIAAPNGESLIPPVVGVAQFDVATQPRRLDRRMSVWTGGGSWSMRQDTHVAQLYDGDGRPGPIAWTARVGPWVRTSPPLPDAIDNSNRLAIGDGFAVENFFKRTATQPGGQSHPVGMIRSTNGVDIRWDKQPPMVGPLRYDFVAVGEGLWIDDAFTTEFDVRRPIDPRFDPSKANPSDPAANYLLANAAVDDSGEIARYIDANGLIHQYVPSPPDRSGENALLTESMRRHLPGHAPASVSKLVRGRDVRNDAVAVATRWTPITGDATIQIITAPDQYVRVASSGDEQTIEATDVLVTGRSPEGDFRRYSSPVNPDDTAATRWLDYRSDEVAKLVRLITPQTHPASADGSSRIQSVRAVTSAVLDSPDDIRSEPFRYDIESASETLRRGKTDSMAASVVTGAIARGAGLPTRLVIGLRRYRGDEFSDQPWWVLDAWVIIHDGKRWSNVDDDQADRVALHICDFKRESFDAGIDKAFEVVRTVEIEVRGSR